MEILYRILILFALLVWPVASAENGKIACASTRDSKGKIYGMNPDGSEITRLTNNQAGDKYPAWLRTVRRLPLSPTMMELTFLLSHPHTCSYQLIP
jgi:hypothetical protein